MVRVALQARVVDDGDARLGLQPAGDPERGLVLLPDAQRERLHAADEQVGGHRVERRAGDLAEVEDLRDECRIARDDAAEGIRVAAEELRGAVEDEIGPEGERALVDGRGKGVVDDDDGPGGMARGGQPLDVQHLERGVGGRLQVEQPGAARDGGLDGVVVAGVLKVHVDADARQELEEDAVGAAVGVADGDDAIARARAARRACC